MAAIINTLPNVEAGYKSAQLYYGQLKQKFITQLQNSLTVSAQQLLRETEVKIEDLIVQGGNQIKNTKSVRDEKLNKILNDFAAQLMRDANVSATLAKAKKEIEELPRDNKKDQLKQKEKIISSTHTILTSQITPKILRQKFITAIGNHNLGTNIEERYDALIDRVYQFLHYFIKSNLLGNTSYSIYGIPQITLGGLIAEDLEYQNLLKIFNSATVTPGGTKKITNRAGKTVSTELDNIISNLEFIQANFQKQYSAQQEILGSNYINSQQLLNTIQYFGEQIKTFNLSKGRVNQGHLIGERESLGAEARSKGVYSVYDNIRFMGRYKSIIQAFGAANVLFSSGQGRQWTDEFIEDFRNQGYYLMLQYQNKNKKMVLTNKVILDYPLNKSGKKYKAYRRVKLV